MRRQLADGYELDDDPERVDPGAVWAFLSTEAYWGRERTRADLDRQLQAASRLVGLYRGREQVGFARIVTDGRVAYLADVYVLDGHRGRGFGAELVRFAVDEGPHAGLRWMLHSATPTICTRGSGSVRRTSAIWSVRRPSSATERRRRPYHLVVGIFGGDLPRAPALT